MKKPFLSKSSFIRGLQCHKSLYLDKFHAELRDEVSEDQKAIFQSGTEIGRLAQGLFPYGIEIPYEVPTSQKVAMTFYEMDHGRQAIYEATFIHDDVLVRVDILTKCDGGWIIYEVKGGTKLDDVYINDASVQYNVLAATGLNIAKVNVVTINKGYVLEDTLDITKLFAIHDVTNEVISRQPEIIHEISAQKAMLSEEHAPSTSIGPHCKKPYPCDFTSYCWRDIPKYGTVFSLSSTKHSSPFKLYSEGILNLEDVPVDRLSDAQRIEVEQYLRKGIWIDRPALQEFLKPMWYPMAFLDFETVMPAIPIYKGTEPYQQLPFQYSLVTYAHQGAEPVFSDFLGESGTDSRYELIKQLVSEIPVGACVVAYYSAFEKGRLTEMAEAYPEFKDRVDEIVANMIDINLPFKRRDVYHWKMNGTSSLKSVLPAFLPELSYDGLEIRNGGMAMTAYQGLTAITNQTEKERIRQALLTYCRLDTFAMVKLYDYLVDVAGEDSNGQ